MPVLEDVVASPCVRICTLDDAEVCVGCLRTLAEITAWGGLSAAERRGVLAAIEERRAASAPGGFLSSLRSSLRRRG